MNGHMEFLELVAASIDFELTDEEFGRLSTHLARCPECRRAATELRGGAAAIASLPAPWLAPARADQILRAALRQPVAKPRWGLLAVAAMLATIGGGILFAGFQLTRDDDPAPSQPPPSAVAEASLPPSAEPGPEESPDPGAEPPNGPRVTPNPGDPEPTPGSPAAMRFPVPYSRELGPVRVAPAPDDRLWVAFTRDRDTVLALLDAGGSPVAGWPAIVPDASDCELLAAPDGSARLLCYFSTERGECSDGCGQDLVYAFAANGQSIAGFPVSFPFELRSGVDRRSARMVGDSVVLPGYEASDDEGSGAPSEQWLVEIRSNGSIVLGARVAGSMMCCTIGPSGVAHGSSVLEEEGFELRTQLIAFDARGMRPGWPIVVDGSSVSVPAFGPNGQLVFTSWINESSRIARTNPDGSEAAPPLDLTFPLEWNPYGDGPLPPLVDERGRVWVVADGAILGFDGLNAELAGFPYAPDTGFKIENPDCPPPDTGCQSWIEPPVLAPESLVYALEGAPDGKGGKLSVINRDGSIRSGWPKTLQRDGATWDSVTIGDNRVAYAVAVEPEASDRFSTSILAFAPNGTRLWITTVIEP